MTFHIRLVLQDKTCYKKRAEVL